MPSLHLRLLGSRPSLYLRLAALGGATLLFWPCAPPLRRGPTPAPRPTAPLPRPLALQVRPSVLTRVKYSENLIISEDTTFVRRAIGAGYRAVHTEEELSAYSLGSTVSEQPGGKQRFAPAAVRRERYLPPRAASGPRAAPWAPWPVTALRRAAAMASDALRTKHAGSTRHAIPAAKGGEGSGLSVYHGMVS